MKKHKAYFQIEASRIPFNSVTTPDGDYVDDEVKRMEIYKNIFDTHPDIFPTPKNDEKARAMLEVSRNEGNDPDTKHFVSSNILDCGFFVRGKDFFSIGKDFTGQNEYTLYCDCIIAIFEIELDCEYDSLYEYSLVIDGYTFGSNNGEDVRTYYLEDKPEITDDFIVFSKYFDRED